MIGFCAPAILGRTRALPCNANGKALSLFRDPFLLDRHLNHPALSKMVPVEEMLHSSRINITQGDIAIVLNDHFFPAEGISILPLAYLKTVSLIHYRPTGREQADASA